MPPPFLAPFAPPLAPPSSSSFPSLLLGCLLPSPFLLPLPFRLVVRTAMSVCCLWRCLAPRRAEWWSHFCSFPCSLSSSPSPPLLSLLSLAVLFFRCASLTYLCSRRVARSFAGVDRGARMVAAAGKEKLRAQFCENKNILCYIVCTIHT